MNEAPLILQVLPRLDSGGVERGTVEITEAIKAAGMRPLVASGGGALVAHVMHQGGEHVTLPLHSKNPITIRRNAHRLYRLIRQRGVKLIHARSRAPAWSAYLAAQWAEIPFVTTFHGAYGTEGLFKIRYNSVMAKGDRVIAVSQFIRDYILEHYAIDPSIIRVIPRGVDFSTFDETRTIPARIAELTSSWLLPEDHVPIIFCPGRLSPIKGQEVLIRALAGMKDEPFLCILAGKDDGHEEYRMGLEQQIVEAGLEGKVRIRDATSFMNEAYTLSELVVVPSIKTESFGRVAIEAQAMGRLVIATDHGGARETILPNETGYLVPPGDAESLAQAIRYGLHRDLKDKQAMASYAKQHVRRHFTSDRMKDATIAVYRELLNVPYAS